MDSNKKIGNHTESFIVNTLKAYRWWVHLFAYTVAGQPCDIIALKDDRSFLLDAKNSENGIFYLTRIEPNQKNCFEYATSLGIKNCGFVIKYENTLYYLPYNKVKELEEKDIKRVSVFTLDNFKDLL